MRAIFLCGVVSFVSSAACLAAFAARLVDWPSAQAEKWADAGVLFNESNAYVATIPPYLVQQVVVEPHSGIKSICLDGYVCHQEARLQADGGWQIVKKDGGAR
jgi:hypothetical protein